MEEKTKLVEKRQAQKKDEIAQHQFDEAEAEHSRGQAELPAACRRLAGQSAVSDPLALAVCAAQAAAIWRNF